MTALTMSGSKPTIVFGSVADLELNGGKSAEVMTTYVLPLLAAAAVVLLLPAAAVAELEPALELLLLLLPQAAIRTTAAAATAAKRRRLASVLMVGSPLISLVLRRRGDRDPQRLQLTRVAWV